MRKVITGRDFIKMIKPILGLEGVLGIRSITVTAPHDDVATVDVEMIAVDTGSAKIDVYDSGKTYTQTRSYTVEVTEIKKEQV